MWVEELYARRLVNQPRVTHPTAFWKLELVQSRYRRQSIEKSSLWRWA